MRTIFITYADLGNRKNLKTDTILPTINYFKERGELDMVLCRLGKYEAKGVISRNMVPWICHLVIGFLGKIFKTFPARRLEEQCFDFFASFTKFKKGDIVFFHPVAYSKTITKAKQAGVVCVGISSIADQTFVRKLYQEEIEKWGGGEISNDLFDPDKSHDMDYLITYSPAARDSYIQNGYPQNRVVVASPDVNTNRFIPGTPDNHFKVLFPASNLGILKGLQYVLDAWSKVDVPNKELVILGNINGWPKEMETHYRTMIAQDLTITMIGFTKTPEYFIQTSRVVVLPSFTEGFSRSVAEAMSCSVPVITTDRATDTEIFFKDGEHGYIVPLANAQAIAQKLTILGNNEHLRVRMGNNARHAISTKKSYPEKVFAFYSDIKNSINL